MLNNLRNDNLNEQSIENERIVPAITTAFIDALSFLSRERDEFPLNQESRQQGLPTIKIVPFQLGPELKDSIKNPQSANGHSCVATKEDGAAMQEDVPDQVLVRNLIECLSHHFNNVLMGIWGNATLIRLRTGNHTLLATHLQQMEALIENGSSLINMVFGYLGERREYARRARLDQIFQEIKGQDQASAYNLESHNLKKKLQLAGSVQEPQLVAGSVAKILNVLLQGLSTQRSKLAPHLPFDTIVQNKMDQIDALILRGQQIMHYLQTYAGKNQPQMMPTSLKPVLSGVLHDIVQPFSDSAYLLRRLPDITTCLMDRAILSEALRSIMKFMVTQPSHYRGAGAYPNSIPIVEIEQQQNGKPRNLKISIRKANILDEASSMWRVFEPYRTDPRLNNANGLALAAACAVISAHDGSIRERVESDEVKGFQIRIPILELKSSACSSAGGVFH